VGWGVHDQEGARDEGMEGVWEYPGVSAQSELTGADTRLEMLARETQSRCSLLELLPVVGRQAPEMGGQGQFFETAEPI